MRGRRDLSLGFAVGLWSAAAVIMVGAALGARAAETEVPPQPTARKKPAYRTDFAAPTRRRAPRQAVRPVPDPAALLEAKETETRLRRELARAGQTPLERVALQAQLVRAVEAAGEDPLPEFAALCLYVASCKKLGPQKAWEQADEVIHQLYTARYYDECIRYSRMVLGSDWADREARAWAWLRIITCRRVCNREGTVHALSERLMREYPATAAARKHTKAAAGWMEAYLRDGDAIALLDRMAEQHSGDPAFVHTCSEAAARICRRIKRYDHLARYVTVLKSLAANEQGVEPEVRRRCAQDLRWIERTLERARRIGEDTSAPR